MALGELKGSTVAAEGCSLPQGLEKKPPVGRQLFEYEMKGVVKQNERLFIQN